MKKNLFFAALAITALVSCSESDYLGDERQAPVSNDIGAINFGFDVPNVTRAGGAAAASALGNQFIVYGEKGDITNEAPTTGNLVFPNYQVNYTANSAYTTTSNTKNWEYVGATHSANYQTNITRKADASTAAVGASSVAQTSKYWDYSAGNYIFTAVSADNTDIESGRVRIQKNEYGTTAYDKGYTITLAKTGDTEPYTYPTLNKLYFSDRQVIAQGTGSDRTAVNAYGGNVTLTFRNLVSQIRAGVYETIPGYDIIGIKFYVSDSDNDNALDETTDHAFGAICPNTKVSDYEGTLTVTYYSNTEGNENQPKVTASGTPAADLILGDDYFSSLESTTPTLLGKDATHPTWDKTNGAFTEVLPQINNTTNLKLTVDYTLWNSVSGETIEVKGATAEVPAEYLRWKPNYKYTYLFKISDNTNGHTGPGTDPAGLWPITFDAVVVAAENGQAEYITTVSEPSITTFGVKSNKYTTDKDEYESGSDIYVAVVDGSTVQALTLGTNINVYSVATSDDTNFPITEASVAESLAETSAKTHVVTATPANNDASSYFTAVPAVASEVPGEDGVNISIECSLTSSPSDWNASDNVYYTDKACTTQANSAYADGTYYKKWTNALKLTGVNTGTYAIQYIKTPATYGCEEITYATQAEYDAAFAALNLYTDSSFNTAAAANSWVDETTKFYKQVVTNPGVYTYKIIKVVNP